MIVRAGISLFRLVRAVGFPLPQKFRFPLCLGHPSSPDKERIAQAIHKFDDLRIERFFSGQANTDPFGPATNRPSLMQRRCHFSSPWQNELFQRCQFFLTSIDHALKSSGILRLDRRHVLEDLSRSGRQYAAEIEQLVLHPAKILFQLFGRCATNLRVHRPYQPDRGIQFIHRAVRLDAQTVFGDLLSAGQPSTTRVTGSRVHLCNSHRSPSLRFRDRCGTEPAFDHMLKTNRAETIMERLFDPIHLLLGNHHLPAPALVSAALEHLPAVLAGLVNRPSQNSTPGCALMPFRNGCFTCFISVTRSASSINISLAPRPVMTTCCLGGRARSTGKTSATLTYSYCKAILNSSRMTIAYEESLKNSQVFSH